VEGLFPLSPYVTNKERGAVIMISFPEIEVTRKYEQFGIEVVKGRERMSMIRNFQKGYYLDLSCLATALNVNMSKLLEDLAYNSAISGYFAHYRNEGRIIKVVDIECVNSMIRNLAGADYDFELLRCVKNKIINITEQMGKEVGRNGN
jgi:hypothetical protein